MGKGQPVLSPANLIIAVPGKDSSHCRRAITSILCREQSQSVLNGVRSIGMVINGTCRSAVNVSGVTDWGQGANFPL